MISDARLLITSIFFFLKLITAILSSLKDLQNHAMKPLPQYRLCLFSMHLNGNIADIEKHDGICSSTFVVNIFSGLLLHPSVFSIKYSRSA